MRQKSILFAQKLLFVNFSAELNQCAKEQILAGIVSTANGCIDGVDEGVRGRATYRKMVS